MQLELNIETLLNKERIESNRIEFKEGWNPDDIYRTICAFANDFDSQGGGYIIVGVKENNGIAQRPVIGVSEDTIDAIHKEMVGYDKKIIPAYSAHTSVEEVDGKRSICGYKSGAFKPSELHYDSTFKEILAVKRGIEKFQFHLLGHNFLVEMDMSSFPKMLQFKRKMLSHP